MGILTKVASKTGSVPRLGVACQVLPLALLLALPAAARVIGVQVDSSKVLADGAPFGLAGAYESVSGKLLFAVDPKKPANRIIADIDLAPLNGDGEVEFSADFELIKPKDLGRGNGALLLDVVNRGRPTAVRKFNRATSQQPLGDGLLMRLGYSVLMVGWQHDAPPNMERMRLYSPIATGNGESIRGLVRANFTTTRREKHQPLGDRGHLAYPVADEDAPENKMTVLDAEGRPKALPRSSWSFVHSENGKPFADGPHVALEGGFEPFKIYEVVYRAKDPWLAGLGPAAIRDAVSHLVNNGATELGVTRHDYDRALAWGSSQSGRFLRGFIYDGFNMDEARRRVFAGVFANIAGGSRGGFNFRFAQPSRSGSHPSRLFPAIDFPFTDLEQQDPLSGRKGGLQSALDPKYRPKVFYTNTSNEYWRAAASMAHTTIDGKTDAQLPDNVRIYFIAGTQHGPAGFPPQRGIGEQLANPMYSTWALRALLPALDAWVRSGTEPPESRYPKISGGELVSSGRVAFPAIPGVRLPAGPRPARRTDYGPRYLTEHIIDKEPPEIGKPYPLLLPAVDEDGNETSGILLPDLVAPLGTYTGWNLYNSKSGMTNQINLSGSYIPFPKTQEERGKTRDPRRSIEERYSGRSEYLGLVAEAAVQLATDGLLLQEDVSRVISDAARNWDHRMQARHAR